MIAVGGALSVAGFRFGLIDTPYAFLQRYQIDKLHPWESVEAQFEPAPIVFLGDSSLGNAVDAAAVQKLTGRKTLNLALTGTYGYAGTYNMLRRIAEIRKPSLVVIMHTIDMMTREVSELGDIYTSPDLPFDRVTISSVAKAYLNLTNLVDIAESVGGALGRRSDPDLVGNDYIRQRADSYISRGGAELRSIGPEALNPEKTLYLERVAATCREHRLDCVYLHGPTYERHCRESRAYIEAASAAIRSSGLEVLGATPLCMPEADLGDQPDHVAPDKKTAYTMRLLSLLDPHLPPKPRVPGPTTTDSPMPAIAP